MPTLSLREAEARLDELVHEAARGRDVVITAGDGASVRLVPVVASDPASAENEPWGAMSLASAMRGMEEDGPRYSEDDLVESFG